MEQVASESASEVCPVCSLSQENLTQHLGSHSKEEIILALASQNHAHGNFSESCAAPFKLEEPQKTVSTNAPQEYTSGTPVQSGTTVLGTTVLSTASLLPYHNTLSVPAPLLTGIKNNGSGVSTNILPATFPSMRATYMQNGPTSGISQFAAASSVPVVYRHPNTAFQNINEGSSTPILLQSPQLNLNSYKGVTNQNVVGSYGVGPSFMTQSPNQSEITSPPTSSQIPNPANSLEPITSPVKIVPDVSSINNLQTSNFPSSTVSGNTQGQQTVLCILPFAQVQPSVPPASNYFLYGNNLLPATNIMPEVLQQTGMNYMLATNTSGLSVNNSQFPNTMYYLPSNMPQFGLRQEVPSIPQVIPVNRRSVAPENIVHTSLSKISPSIQTVFNSLTKINSSSTQTVFNSALNGMLINHTSGNVSEQQSIQIDKSSNCVVQEKISSPESIEDAEKKVTIEVGGNIKISLPHDVVDKKERLKELINRELVRAILINDSEEAVTVPVTSTDFETKRKCGSPSKIKKGVNNTKSSSIECSMSHELNNSPHISHEADQKSINTFTVSCNPNNTGYIDLNGLQMDPQLPSTSNISLEDSNFKNDSGTLIQKVNDNGVDEKHFNNNESENQLKNHIIDLSSSSHDTLFSRTKAHIKNTNSKHLPTSSGTHQAPGIKFKNEGQGVDDTFTDTSLTFLSPERSFNILGDAIFSDISYVEDQVLGAVEEVFTGENSVHSTCIDCKFTDLPLVKSSTSFSFGASNISFENQLSNSLPEEDTLMQSPNDDSFPELSAKVNSVKYAKTYFRVKKTNHLPGISRAGEGNLTPLIAEASQINLKLQNISDHTDEEIVDDPPSEEMETNTHATNETYSNGFSSKGLLREEESFSDDSKEVGTSLYQGVPLKIENGESNGTHTEEVMSLKASETLADSDSERATPSEEMAEIYYGKSCIFAGEPGPPNLSSQAFPHIEDSEEHLAGEQIENESERDATPQNSSSPAKLSFNVNSTQENVENVNEDTISLTLDANCSILPADTLHLPQLFNQGSSNVIDKGGLLKEVVWTKPSLTNWSKLQEESKTFVTTGIVEGCSSVSPHASTSGLQSLDFGAVKKSYREEEEYDFEYESDCYGDSDSDIGHVQRGPLDLERWRCNKCNKTFKSLKEKLLHSGHHSPCSNGKAVISEAVGFLTLENAPCNEQIEKSPKTLPVPVDLNERSEKDLRPAESSSKESKTTRNTRSKRKKSSLKFKEEEKEVAAVEDWHMTRSVTTSEGDFKCSECPLTFPTVDKLYDHRANAFKSRHICPVCHLEFKKRIGKLRHLKIHPSSELKCLICHRNFDSYYSWSQHQLFHMGLIVYECKECGHKCQRKGELEIHYRKHSGEKPFKCETCLNTFVSSHSLKRHLIVHMEGQETECDVCHNRYKNAIGLSKHKLKMHPKKKKFLKKRTDFMCDTCNEVFHSEKKLAWHQETHERWPKKCQQCGECFIHQSNLTKHIRFKHDPCYIPAGSTKENVSCTVCKKAYKRSSLSLHMRTHTGIKPYKCSVCGKEFTVKCNYLSHKWVHTGIRDRPYKCKLCERSFHRKRFLEAHVRSHKKIRPYTCNECGKSFIHKSNFQTHSRLHTEEKQHECGYCGKTFFRKYNLNNHIRIHTRETPFRCTFCTKVFTQKSNFNVHMKAFHVERHAIHEEV